MTPWEFIVLRAVDLASEQTEVCYATAADVAVYVPVAIREAAVGGRSPVRDGRDIAADLVRLRKRGLLSNDGPASMRGGQLGWAPTLAGRDVLDA